MKYVTDYLWVVACTNHRFHHKGNIGYEHKVMLRETDAFSSLSLLPDKIDVRCDACGEEYSYKLKEVMRDEVPGSRSVRSASPVQIGLVLYDRDAQKPNRKVPAT